MGLKITELTELTSPADTDLLVIVDISATRTKKIKVENLLIPEPTTTVTSDHTITKNHEVVMASGDLTITLAAATNARTAYIANVGTGAVTIQGSGSDLIEGSSQLLLSGQYESVTLKSNGVATWVRF